MLYRFEQMQIEPLGTDGPVEAFDVCVKLFEPKRLDTTQSWKKAKLEIAKCDVVCANCHRMRTFSAG